MQINVTLEEQKDEPISNINANQEIEDSLFGRNNNQNNYYNGGSIFDFFNR